MNVTLLISLTSGVAAGFIGFSAAWNIQGRAIDSLKMEQKDERIEQQRAARATSERLAQQVITAQNAAAARNVRIAADSRRAGDAGNGLRLASTNAVRASTTDSDACSAIVAAYGVVVDESISFIREVTTVADQCISDNKALTDGWQK